MALFPLLKHVRIEKYGLYPGFARDGTFEVTFRPGVTLILGANGLGKTTLMTLLYRMLAGTQELGLPEGEVGNARLEAYDLSAVQRKQFANRVNDGAENATCELTFDLGTTTFSVRRKLANLALDGWTLGGTDQALDEQKLRDTVTHAAGLGTFSDWLLVLRTLVFFFEDRRALVWDSGAQRQLLRCLLLTPTQAADWTKQERSILSLDSRLRNLQAAFRKEEKIQRRQATQIEDEPGVRDALEVAEQRRQRLTDERDALTDRIRVAERSRQEARLSALRAQDEYDRALRELERARLLAIESRMPNADQSVRFIYARLMSDNQCLVCTATDVAEVQARLAEAVAQRHCVVCDSVLAPAVDVIELNEERLQELQRRVERSATQLVVSATNRDEAHAAYLRDSEQLALRATEIEDAHQQVANLVNQLPPDQSRRKELEDRFQTLNNMVTELRAQLETERATFNASLDSFRATIHQSAARIKEHFEAVSSDFLYEESRLSWTPDRRLVGQTGGDTYAEYPAFSVELGGSDFVGVQRRANPAYVSESQREFIDLAFRMALIEVTSPDHVGTICIDAPESSLDAIFVDRAATVLARFADGTSPNRLVVTSNLGAGPLVPELLRKAAPPGERAKTLTNLFKAGQPTKAMVDGVVEYERYLAKLMIALEEP
ncbi:ATP-binding protein [Arenimonas terrae]|nr:ATP-binding protein [Arenimonas terrae]